MSTTTPTPHFKSAIITGAGGGLGSALAKQLLDSGCKVALLDTATNRALTDAMQQKYGDLATCFDADVRDAKALQSVAQAWMARHGAPDLVIANAGIAGGFDTLYAEDMEVLQRMLDINLRGVVHTFQPFLQAMLDDGRATGAAKSLVGIASIAGWRGMPGNGAYCASKAALIAYLQALRAELRGTPVHVHTVSPGYLRTAMTAANTFAMPGLMDADTAAQTLINKVQGGSEKIVLPPHIGWLQRALSLLPDQWFDHLLRGQPRKPREHQNNTKQNN
ncbi:MAG TPA: SDR family oxidoreductase [Burkholderiaceae bacterium]|nr:SDR family oxidoreductase [Burkholderiaceae bacterium]